MEEKGETLGSRVATLGTSSPCLKRTIAHEAMHGVYKTLPMRMINPYADIEPEGWDEGKVLYYGKVGDWTWNGGGTLNEDYDMSKYLDACFDCPKKK